MATLTLAMRHDDLGRNGLRATLDTIASTTCMNGALSERDKQGRRGILEEE